MTKRFQAVITFLMDNEWSKVQHLGVAECVRVLAEGCTGTVYEYIVDKYYTSVRIIILHMYTRIYYYPFAVCINIILL